MNIFKQFIKSIYSPKDMALFRFQGIGKTILYVFFITLVSILPSIIYLSTATSTGINTAKEVFKDEIPSFSIENGVLNSESKVPITIKKDQFTIFLDSTGAVSEKEVQKEGNAFALLKDEFVFAAGGNIQTYPYSMLKGIQLTNKEVLQYIDNIDSMKVILLPVLSIMIFLFSSAASFIKVTLLAVIGLLLRNLLGRKLHYGHLWRLSAYSITLPTVFFTIMAALKTAVPNGFLINWLVTIIVLYLCINEIPKPKKAL